MKDITIAMPFVEQSLLGARHAGYDVDKQLLLAGISPGLLTNPKARIGLDEFTNLIQRIMGLMDDEALGLTSHPMRLGTLSLITRSVLHERDLVGALRRYVRSYNLLPDAPIYYFEDRGSELILGMRRPESAVIRSVYLLESALLTAHRFLCWLGRTRIRIHRVELDYPAPEWAPEYRYLFFGAPTVFDRSDCRLFLNKTDLQEAVKQDVESLNTYIRRAPRDLFTPLASTQASHQARQIILDAFRSGKGMPRAGDVAEKLGLSEQTFWRRLQAEGLDFTQIRTRVRRDLAISLLSERTLSIEQIAETIGYSESSAFIRAFKEWTGITPLAYRKL